MYIEIYENTEFATSYEMSDKHRGKKNFEFMFNKIDKKIAITLKLQFIDFILISFNKNDKCDFHKLYISKKFNPYNINPNIKDYRKEVDANSLLNEVIPKKDVFHLLIFAKINFKKSIEHFIKRTEKGQKLQLKCSYCGSEEFPISGEKFKRCNRCKNDSIRYCSRECQIADWGNHKRSCVVLSSEQKKFP